MAKKPTTSTTPEKAPVDKRAKFHEIAKSRVSNALNAIRLIGNCANRQTYEYTEEEISAIRRALTSAVDDAMQRYAQAEKPGKPTFDF